MDPATASDTTAKTAMPSVGPDISSISADGPAETLTTALGQLTRIEFELLHTPVATAASNSHPASQLNPGHS